MRQRSRIMAGASAAVYAVVTAIIGREVLAGLSSSIASDAGDPVFTAMLIQWNATHLPLADSWWQLPTYFPLRDTLAFSEHLLGLSVVATPLFWITGDAIVAYNLTALLTFPLCAMAMYALVYRLTGSAAGAFVAGLAFGFAPYRMGQLPHIQVLAAFWIPLALLGLHAFLETGRRRWLVLYAGAWVLQVTTNAYTVVTLSLLAAAWVIWFVVLAGRWRLLGPIAAATAAACAIVAPIFYRFLSVHARNGFVRTIGEMHEFSADLAAVLCAPQQLTFWGWLRVHCRPEGELFPGVTIAVLAAAGLAGVLSGGRGGAPADGGGGSSSRRRLDVSVRVTLAAVAGVYAVIVAAVLLAGPLAFDLGPIAVSASSVDKPITILLAALMALLVLSPGIRKAARESSALAFSLLGAMAMWVLALGPTVTFLGRGVSADSPFALLAPLPGFSGLRVPARFWLMSIVCLSVAAGFVVAARPRRSRVIANSVLALIAAAALADGWARIGVVPRPLPASVPPGAVVLELPARDDFRDIAAQYRAVTGGWTTVNGYSGHEPRHYPALVEGLNAGDAAALTPLREMTELHVLVARDAGELQEFVARQPGAEAAGSDAAFWYYRLPRLPAPPEPPAAAALPIASVRASCSTHPAGGLIDGTAGKWRCDPPPEHPQVVLDLGGVMTVGAVTYDLGTYFWEFPRSLKIETSTDGQAWSPAWSGSVIDRVIRSAIDSPTAIAFDIPFAPRPARFVRLRHMGRDGGHGWTAVELGVKGAAWTPDGGPPP